MWIGTTSGLNRFDRFTNTFKVYRFSSDNPTSISDNTITAIQSAGDDHLWVGTRNGLNLMDKRSESFRAFKSSAERGNFSISNNLINDIAIDSQKRMWCATGAGLNLLDPSDSTFLTFNHLFDSPGSISHPVVNCLEADGAGNVWVGTEGGITKISADLKVQRMLEPQIPDFAGFSDPVLSMVMTSEQMLWIGTDADFMCLSSAGEITHGFSTDSAINGGLKGGAIRSLLQDKSGAVWIGTTSDGLFRFSTQQQIFTHFFGAAKGEVRTSLETEDGEWIVGGRDGLFQIHPDEPMFDSFDATSKSVRNAIVSPVRSIVRFGDHYYVGLSGNGLLKLDLRWRLVKHITVNATNPLGLNSNRISCLLPDEHGIWVGTSGGGLSFYDPATDSFHRWQFDGNRLRSLLDNKITALTRDLDGYLWIGTANRGLSRLDIARNEFTHYEHQPEDTAGISSNRINGLLIDRKNRLWIATGGGGLNVFHGDKKSFEVFRSFHGLPANTVTAVVEDEAGILWVSTNSGLARVDYEGMDIRKFNIADGLQQLEFLPGVAGKTGNGDLWFGSTQGLVLLNPAAYVPETFAPPIVFTEVTVTEPINGVQREVSFFPGDQKLEYSYGIHTISIEFAMLSLMQAGKNKYAYRIDNMMDQWSDLGNQRTINLSTPDPGTYRIMVKGTNHDGIPAESYSELELVIHPVIWQTAGFKFLIIILLSGGIYLFYRWRLNRIRSYNKMLERVVKNRTQEIAKERDEKAVLLKEIHHRVKNNLQIISSLLSLQSRFSGDPKIEELFLESTNRVQSMSMIHEKMYRSENLKEVSLKQYIRELVTALIDAYSVNMDIEAKIDVNVEYFAVDTLTPLGLIINELVSNSLKYAFRNRNTGNLFLTLNTGEDDYFKLIIGDDGVGFTEADIREGAFGTELVEDLAGQLQGSIERVPSDEGTVFLLTFKDIDNH